MRRRQTATLHLELLEDRLAPTASLAWAVNIDGATLFSGANAEATDSAGNVYVTGAWGGTLNFNPLGAADNLTSQTTNRDIFVAKYSPAGQVLWVDDFGNAGTGVYNVGDTIAVDGSGNVYVGGSIQGTVQFGTTSLTSVGLTDGFLAKLNNNGTVLAAIDTTAGNLAGDNGATGRVVVDAAGDVFASGAFDAPSGAAAACTMFVTKYSSALGVDWTQQIDSFYSGDDVLAVDNLGSVYVLGTYAGTLTLGTSTFTTASASIPNTFVAKLSSATGSVTWAENLASPTSQTPNDLQVDGDGNVILCTTFENSETFLGNTLNTTTPTSFATFIAKLAPNGTQLWDDAIQSGPGEALGVDANNNVYVVGYLPSTITFGSTVATGSDTMIGIINGATGDSISASTFGNAGGSSISFVNGNAYIAGDISGGSVNMDPTGGTHDVTAHASTDAFVIKVNSLAASAPTLSFTSEPDQHHGRSSLGTVVVEAENAASTPWPESLSRSA